MRSILYFLLIFSLLIIPINASDQNINTSIIYYSQANDLMENISEENTIEAISLLEKSIELNPYFTNAYMSLADCYRILYEFNPHSDIYFEKMLDNSIRAISWGKFFNEDISNAYLTVARGYGTKKNYEKSIQFYKLYINLKPNDPVGYRELGNIYYDVKLYKPAFAAYLLEVKYAPYDVDSICRISELSKKLNAYEEYKEYESACIEFNNILLKQEEDIEDNQTTSTSPTTETKNTPGFEIGAVSAAALLVGYYLKRRK